MQERVARPRPSGRRLITGLVLGVAVVLALWSLYAALGARSHLLGARHDLEALRSSQGLDLTQVQAQLDPARSEAGSAVGLLSQPGPRLVSHVPGLGRNLRGELEASRAALALVDALRRVVPRTAGLGVAGGQVDLARLDALRAELDGAGASLAAPVRRLRAVPLGGTLPALHRTVRDTAEQVGALQATFAHVSDGVAAAKGLLGGAGPRTLLVAVMNNAELRGAGGYASSIATVTTDQGRIALGGFSDVNTFEDTPETARPVPAPPDYEARWSRYKANSTLWKNVFMSPDVPASAAVACAVARVVPGTPCDGVVLLDVPLLARTATIAGPVALPDGKRLSGADLLRALLVEQYEVKPVGGQSARRAALGTSADNALRDLLGRALDPGKVVRVLGEGVGGRHLSVWSARPEEQAGLVRAGLSGSADPLGDDLGLVSVNQFSRAKLDYYVARAVSVDVQVGERSAVVRQKVSLALDMPDGVPKYVFGDQGGHLVGLADVAVGPDATVAQVLQDGAPAPHDLVRDTGSQRVEVHLDVANHAATTYEVVYEVPLRDGAYRLRLLPQPLARDARLHLAVRPAPGLALVDGPVTYDGTFRRAQTVAVRVGQLPWWRRLG